MENLVKDLLDEIQAAIDLVLGDGYSRRNPDLVARVYAAEAQIEGAKVLGSALNEIADALRK